MEKNNEETLNFEEKIVKAKEILEKLTKNDITLSDSLKLYNEGLKELEVAQKLLEEAKLVFTTQNKS
ncbi:exodeoxyribonuclease VII small subunit [Aliarcobacter cibarius]|jgi:exodeoxyribonuclease VII small subunit|uniref:Exodeoxyribonuclease VII small subunit n=1 Tax=Aliarcobacter cibarius TaxID=255507 RepID=A0A5J6RIN2_9BACT|nr:exodeoxyribonuclease VII small subunit [Aliarcobacter cibarius]QEZ89273.1 exodeoxyribonuclease VII, small subunit [Aliarcobacter cibarius]QKJ27306.1 exodeoxyribonuclease VII, small subunit [Aliarcobacter cibarius]TLS95377.1 exodeoxyribonuclease VII small subunit [Aliarcobacter cibarius]TLS95865.1 exodeoxyribonuclease VII small subunit [Aliarcobacter cibarius]TLT02999.1 exodeoxyribonuclease VII small subunit [Aliarcobacter cibarius]